MSNITLVLPSYSFLLSQNMPGIRNAPDLLHDHPISEITATYMLMAPEPCNKLITDDYHQLLPWALLEEHQSYKTRPQHEQPVQEPCPLCSICVVLAGVAPRPRQRTRRASQVTPLHLMLTIFSLYLLFVWQNVFDSRTRLSTTPRHLSMCKSSCTPSQTQHGRLVCQTNVSGSTNCT